MAAMMGKSKLIPPHLLAGGLLLVMAALLGVAWHFHIPALKAFAEAALAGGIADWFAVTALFRRPLGLPIPHTGLIPANQKRLGRALGDFVRDNFLAPDLVAARLRQGSPATWLADRLAQPEIARVLARRLLRLADDADSRTALLALVQPGPSLARALRMIMRHHGHQRAFDRLLDGVAGALAADNSFIVAKVADGSGRWVPAWVDRKLAEKLSAALADGLDDLRRADHPWRQGFERWLHTLAQRLGEDRDLDARLTKAGEKALADWLAEDRLLPGLSAAIAGWGRALAADQAARARLDRRLIRVVERALVPSRHQIGDFIAQVVERWDGATLVAKLEAQVGGDLQYIRVNGTLVGGLAGLAIYGLSDLLG